jgi:hypothetical protein
LTGRPGERIQSGGVSMRLAVGRIAFQKSFFEGIIRSAIGYYYSSGNYQVKIR